MSNLMGPTVPLNIGDPLEFPNPMSAMSLKARI